MLSNNKRKEALTSSETPKKKLSRSVRYNKKRRLEKEARNTISIVEQSDDLCGSETSPTLSMGDVYLGVTSSAIIFDPNRNRTQFATRGLCTEDKILYIERDWKSVLLSPLDRISSKKDKTQGDASEGELIIETLIRESRLDGSIKSFEIPYDFLTLVMDEIIEAKYIGKVMRRKCDLNENLWLSLGKWLGMKEPYTRRDVRQHFRCRWKKLKHAMELRNSKDLLDSLKTINERISRQKKTQLIISARGDFHSLKGLVQFRYVAKPECITDKDGRTLIHLENLNNPSAIMEATEATNHYYFHTLNNPSHRSNNFWEDFIEHFGAYALYNIFPYTSSNTASTHNTEHQECVDNLLRSLNPLSICVNKFIEENYQGLYEKLLKLEWGVFAPRLFGVFPMIAINFNTMSDFHWDEHDDPNSLCCLVALGEFEGGELCFPQLQIVVPLRPGQIVAFSSRLLLHGNFPITRGIRHSIVYFVHSMFFHHLRDFSSIYNDLETGVERDARGSIVPMIPRQDLNDARDLNKRIRLDKPKPSQIRVPPSSSDCRRGRIDR